MSAPVTTHDLRPLKPILTAHLFPKVDGLLLELLRSLSSEEWERQTVSPKWKVKDVAAHLLDTALRGMSIARDVYAPPAPNIDSPTSLGAYIDRLNEEGVKVYRRLSPEVLISLMENACRQLAEYHAGRDPFAQAPYGVSWAGEEKSINWFDTAREYTERWHHQQQIRLAVCCEGAGLTAILTRELYYPVLDCFMRALPFTYRNVSAPAGTAIRTYGLRRMRRELESSSRGCRMGAYRARTESAQSRNQHPARNRMAHFHKGHRPRIRRIPS